MKVISVFLLGLFSYSVMAQPIWVESPDEAGYTYAIVGSAMPQQMGERAQFKMAEFSARQAFAADQEVFIASVQNSSESDTSQRFESQTTISTSRFQSFSALQFIEQWQNPETGELFLLYAVK